MEGVLPENVGADSETVQSTENETKNSDKSDLAVQDDNVNVESSSTNPKMIESEDDISKNEFAKTDSDVKEMFSDAMIEKLEQSEDVADAGDLANLLDGTDELIFRTNGQNGIGNGVQKGEKEERENDARRSDVREATSLLLQGKRNIIVEDYESAVETLAEACEKYTALFGELGDECGEVYLTYATALIELARLKEKEKNEEDDEINAELEDENAKIDDDVENGENEIKEEKQNGAVNGAADDEEGEAAAEDELDEDDKDEDDKDEDDKDGDEKDEEKGDENNEKPENGSDDEEEVDTEDDFDNLEVAWQVLELAKRIFTNLKENHHLATVYTRLGEVSLSSGNYDLAIEDLKRSLEIQNSLPSVSIRYKAVNHFNLFLAYKSKLSFEEADRELYALKSCCQRRLDELEDTLETLKKEENKEFEIKKVTAEIQESKDVLKEVDEKFDESRKEKRGIYQKVSDAILSKAELLNRTCDQSSTASSSSCVVENSCNFVSAKSDVPVNNISHLVRKKKKVTFDQSEEDENSKNDKVSSRVSELRDKKFEICSEQSASREDAAEKTVENGDNKVPLLKSEIENTDGEKVKNQLAKNEPSNCSDSVSRSTSSCNSGKRKADENTDNPAKKLCAESV